MNLPSNRSAEPMAVADFKGLAQLKVKAQAKDTAAIEETARQFEALFVQMMLKNMRASHHFVEEDSPFRSQAEGTFQEMLDAQYAQKISQNGGIGVAKALVAQMTPHNSNHSSSHALKELSLMDRPAATNVNAMPAAKETTMVSEFVQSLLPYAKTAAAILGVDPKILLAQAALETGWGKGIAMDEKGGSSHNFFNIKAPVGQENNAVNIKTTEFVADNPVKVSQWFKQYTDPGASFEDYVALVMHSERYTNALQHGGNSREYIKALQDAGYATDPKYAEKILQIYDSEALKSAMR